MNNNTVPTHSVVDPRAGSQTPPCWLKRKTNHFLYKIIYIYIVGWRNSMGIYSKNSNNMSIIKIIKEIKGRSSQVPIGWLQPINTFLI